MQHWPYFTYLINKDISPAMNGKPKINHKQRKLLMPGIIRPMCNLSCSYTPKTSCSSSTQRGKVYKSRCLDNRQTKIQKQLHRSKQNKNQVIDEPSEQARLTEHANGEEKSKPEEQLKLKLLAQHCL